MGREREKHSVTRQHREAANQMVAMATSPLRGRACLVERILNEGIVEDGR